MKSRYPKNRRIKKALRGNERDLGITLMTPGFNFESKEDNSKLDFWISYYVTWLLRGFNLPKDVWCDGVEWKDNTHILEFSLIGEKEYELNCELDILEFEEASYGSNMSATFRFSSSFDRFIEYDFRLNVNGQGYVYSSQMPNKFNKALQSDKVPATRALYR